MQSLIRWHNRGCSVPGIGPGYGHEIWHPSQVPQDLHFIFSRSRARKPSFSQQSEQVLHVVQVLQVLQVVQLLHGFVPSAHAVNSMKAAFT